MLLKLSVAVASFAAVLFVSAQGIDVFKLFGGGSSASSAEKETRSVSVLEKDYTAPAATGEPPRSATNEPPQSVVGELPQDSAQASEKAPKKSAKTGRPARVTSAVTYYDRKEGVAFFDGNVYVDDEQYQLHAQRAYVFMNASNELRRIVAVGNVAMTNETRRAYGAKASYYREGGMVVLYSGDGITAEVRDESKEQDQVVRGKKIKFWIDTEQVEVLEAEISAPTGGMGKDGVKSGFKKMTGK